jgi:hypothetical protein
MLSTRSAAPRQQNTDHPPLPAAYSAAKTALAQCAKIDECKDYADKAQALAVYAAQAEDESLLNYAKRIRARAIRRQGELLKEIKPAKGSNQNIRVGAHPKVTRKSVAASAGLSEEQQKTALRVANVPEEQFEQQVESDRPPTVQTLAKQGTRKRPTTSDMPSEPPPPAPPKTPVKPVKPEIGPSSPITLSANDINEGAVGARPEINSAVDEELINNLAVEPRQGRTPEEREAAIETKMQGTAAIFALQQKRSLDDLLGALISVRRQHGIGEKDLRPLLAAKPDFDHVELRDLIEDLDDLAVAWVAHEHPVQQHRTAQKNAVPPVNDLNRIPPFTDRRPGADVNAAKDSNENVTS